MNDGPHHLRDIMTASRPFSMPSRSSARRASLSDVTLVMPTFNRSDYALRGMQYWSGSKVRLHVLDGSIPSVDPAAISALKENVTYHHMPGVSVFERLSIAPNLVKTKYCAMYEDDGYLLPGALAECVQALDDDPELVSVMGRCLAFLHDNGIVRGEPQFNEFAGHDIKGDNALERMVESMSTFTPTAVYSLMRADAWRRSMLMYGDERFREARMGELPFEIGAAYSGKCKVISSLYWLRSIENESHPMAGGVTPLHRMWFDPAMKAKCELIVDGLTDSLRASETKEQVRPVMHRAVTAYCNHIAEIERTAPPRERPLGPIAKVRRALFGWLPREVKNAILKTFTPPCYRSITAVADDMMKSGVKVDVPEFQDAIKSISNFWRNR